MTIIYIQLRQVCYAKVKALVEKTVPILAHGLGTNLLPLRHIDSSTSLDSESLQEWDLAPGRANIYCFHVLGKPLQAISSARVTPCSHQDKAPTSSLGCLKAYRVARPSRGYPGSNKG